MNEGKGFRPFVRQNWAIFATNVSNDEKKKIADHQNDLGDGPQYVVSGIAKEEKEGGIVTAQTVELVSWINGKTFPVHSSLLINTKDIGLAA